MKAASKVPSPCISVCSVDDETGLCRGCLRTPEEIATWDGLSDAQKQEIHALLAGRHIIG